MRRHGTNPVQHLPTFAERIRQLRTDHRLSQAAIAEALGVSQSAVASWEVGRTYPEVSRVLRLADLLAVTPGALLDGVSPIITATGEPELTAV